MATTRRNDGRRSAIPIKADHVALLPQRPLVQIARIGQPDPVACLRSVWSLLGLSWSRWELLVLVRCSGAGLATWRGKDQYNRFTTLLTWHKVPALIELMWSDLQAQAKPAAINDAAKLIAAWPDKRRLVASSHSVTREDRAIDTSAAEDHENATQARKSAAQKKAHIYTPKPGRIRITREHESLVLKLLDDGLNTVQIAKQLGISRPAVSMMINGSYRFS